MKKEEIVDAIILVNNLGINTEIKKILIRSLLWIYTERNKKYTTGFETEKAREIKSLYPKNLWQKYLNHEHYVSLKNLINRIIDSKSDNKIKQILKDAKGIVITKEEHKLLNHKLEGDEKYKEARVKILENI